MITFVVIVQIYNKFLEISICAIVIVEAMAGKIKIEGNNLVFEITSIDEILSFKRTIYVPLEHIVDVSTEKVKWEHFHQSRVLGTAFPGLVKDGIYLTSEGLVFFEMHDLNKCITITLKGEKYKKIVFEVENKEESAKMIIDAIKKTNNKSD